LKTQEEALREFEAKAEEFQKAGKWVFENHALAEELLQAAREKNEKELRALARKHKLSARVEKQFLELAA